MRGIENIQKIVPVQQVVRTNDPRHNNSDRNTVAVYENMHSFEDTMKQAMQKNISIQEPANVPVLSNYDRNAQEIFYYMYRKADYKC